MRNFQHNDLCVGIDLGTTNSALATISVVNGKIKSPVRNIQRFGEMNTMTGRPTRSSNYLLPSCVYYRPERDGGFEPVVGDFAKRQYMVKPWLVAKSIKSQMGEPKVKGLQEDIPDKTPEEVSARILKHMLADAEDHFACKIDDVVITVPAIFNSAMREATLRAAEIAGINVRNEDGSFNDDMLLSEPEAVMYDLINQIQEGTYDANIDFSEKKNVLVFDIGGGTLDITIHEVKRDDENPDILKISPIAINRYTKIGGDNFDEMIADEMYRRYLKILSGSQAIIKRIEKDPTVKPSLLMYAEELKLEISNRYYELKQSGKEQNDTKLYDCGGLLGNGYSYDDAFTRDEFEEVLRPLMGYGLKLSDYKDIDRVDDTYNIVYPVLNVLKKASEQLGCGDVKIDAVVLNGGMSKLYLIQNRLEELFGFKPLTVADPDKSVAMGAAVYHYYLHKNSNALKRFRQENVIEKPISRGITTGQSILNDDIYLGMKGGAAQILCKAGRELPYRSEVMTGFSIFPNQNTINIPIKQKTGINTYKTIAGGKIEFNRGYKEQTPVSIRFGISKSQILTLEAWTSKDEIGIEVIETGKVSLKFGDESGKNTAAKMIPRSGTNLIAANEISNLKSLCEEIRQQKPRKKAGGSRIKNIKEQIKTSMAIIEKCGNPEDFGEPILSLLGSTNNEYLKQRLFDISCSLAQYWTDEQRRRLERTAYNVLQPELYGFNTTGEKMITNSFAIRALGSSGDGDLCEGLIALSSNPYYTDSLVYTFKKAMVNTEWVNEILSSEESFLNNVLSESDNEKIFDNEKRDEIE